MVSEADLIRSLIGGQTQRAFARSVGCSESFVSLLLDGTRHAGVRFVRRLVAAFPERADELTSFYLSRNKQDFDVHSNVLLRGEQQEAQP